MVKIIPQLFSLFNSFFLETAYEMAPADFPLRFIPFPATRFAMHRNGLKRFFAPQPLFFCDFGYAPLTKKHLAEYFLETVISLYLMENYFKIILTFLFLFDIIVFALLQTFQQQYASAAQLVRA